MIITPLEIAVLPNRVGVSGETPRAAVTVWVSAIVVSQIRVWESVWGFYMRVWEHGAPGLALLSRYSDRSCATITLAFASVALLC